MGKDGPGVGRNLILAGGFLVSSLVGAGILGGLSDANEIARQRLAIEAIRVAGEREYLTAEEYRLAPPELQRLYEEPTQANSWHPSRKK